MVLIGVVSESKILTQKVNKEKPRLVVVDSKNLGKKKCSDKKVVPKYFLCQFKKTLIFFRKLFIIKIRLFC